MIPSLSLYVLVWVPIPSDNFLLNLGGGVYVLPHSAAIAFSAVSISIDQIMVTLVTYYTNTVLQSVSIKNICQPLYKAVCLFLAIWKQSQHRGPVVSHFKLVTPLCQQYY